MSLDNLLMKRNGLIKKSQLDRLIKNQNKSQIKPQIKTQEQLDKENYQLILNKINAGEELTGKELEKLKVKNQKLYDEVKGEIKIDKQFEESLIKCKDKREAKSTYMTAVQAAQNMCGVKANQQTEANIEQFQRLVKRIDKTWKEYESGKLNKTTTTKADQYQFLYADSKDYEKGSYSSRG